jgi:hypothetical protein
MSLAADETDERVRECATVARGHDGTVLSHLLGQPAVPVAHPRCSERKRLDADQREGLPPDVREPEINAAASSRWPVKRTA